MSNPMTDDGLYPGLTYDEYAAIPAVRHSFLVDMIKKSPKTAQYIEAMGGRDDTNALMFGRAVHLALLEPAKFDEEILAIPDLDRRTKAGKVAWINFQRLAAGKIVLEAGARGRVREIAHAILNHPSARELFANKGVNEMTMVWTDRETGVRCKGRLDRWTTFQKAPCIMDMKTCRDAAEEAFIRSTVQYGYNYQAAFYLMGAETLQPIPNGRGFPRAFVWLAVESEGPFEIGVFQAHTQMIEHGVMMLREALKVYKKARATGIWPAKNGDGITTIDNPEYVYKKNPIDGNIGELGNGPAEEDGDDSTDPDGAGGADPTD